jgi:type IV secretory pathway TraG/TraD family ATPase VirD4
MFEAKLAALTHGTSGLVLGYASVSIPMIAVLIRRRAPLSKLLLSPVQAVPVMLVAGVAMELTSLLSRSLGAVSEGWLSLTLDVVTAIGVGYASGRLLARRPSADSSYRRGAIVSHENLVPGPQRTRRSRQDTGELPDSNSSVSLAGIRVATQDETKHFKFIGTTGTGKSTAIREILNSALARGDRAVIADPDGGYLGSFYDADRGDVILNPFEGDAAKWNLFGEITNDYDVDQLARSLIPDSGEPDRIWSEYARTFFIAVTQQAIAAGIKDDGELYRMLHLAPVKDLKVLLAGTAAGPFLEDGNEKMFGSVRSITSSAIRALKYTTRQQAMPFSVREWVRQGAPRHAGGQGGVLFLPYKAGEIAALRSMISAWMRIAIFEAMDRREGDQRLWFVVDELDALGEIDGLKDALARLRKFGGRTILGFQSIAQVSGTYGKGTADTIVENCGNTLILRCSASEHGGTSEFASKLIGQREVMHTTRSRTRRPSEWRASTTTSEHLKIEPAIMASEIERLPDLEGYLKFASIPDWRHVRLTPASYPAVVRSRGLDTTHAESDGSVQNSGKGAELHD